MVLLQTPVSEDPALHQSSSSSNALKKDGGKQRISLFEAVQDPASSSDASTDSTSSITNEEDEATSGTASSVRLSEADKEAAREAAKRKLKKVLLKNGRSAKDPEVLEAMEELIKLNPTEDAAWSDDLDGQFVSLTRPEFPGRLKQEPGKEDLDQYTLGRMSFNIFQPKDLVCTITKTYNSMILQSPKEGAEDVRQYAYPLETEIMIETPKGDFPACIQMKAFCSSEKQPKNRMGVTFVGGTLVPALEVRSNPETLSRWKEVFAHAYEKAEAERSYFNAFMNYIFKWVFQMTAPNDEQAESSESCSVHFEMKRCPHGYIDVVYLDHDMRITRGNRGTVVIVERV